MAIPANSQLLQAALSHELGLARLENGLVSEIDRLLVEADADLVKQIEKRLKRAAAKGFDPGPYTTQRLRALLDEVRRATVEAYRALDKPLTASLKAFAAYEVEWQAGALKEAIPFRHSIVRPTREQLAAIVEDLPMVGVTLPKALSDVAAYRFKQIEGIMRVGLVEGETVPNLIRRVRNESGLAISRRHAEAHVRTAANHVMTQTRERLFAQNDDLVKGVQIVATLDSKTTPICRAQDGKVYRMGEGPRPPFHYNCRSTLVPVLKSWKELGFDLPESALARTRASMNGQVPRALDYTGWLRLQGPGFQDRVLGAKRGAIFRANPEMHLRDLMRNVYEQATLVELAAMEGILIPEGVLTAAQEARAEILGASRVGRAASTSALDGLPDDLFGDTPEEVAAVRKALAGAGVDPADPEALAQAVGRERVAFLVAETDRQVADLLAGVADPLGLGVDAGTVARARANLRAAIEGVKPTWSVPAEQHGLAYGHDLAGDVFRAMRESARSAVVGRIENELRFAGNAAPSLRLLRSEIGDPLRHLSEALKLFADGNRKAPGGQYAARFIGRLSGGLETLIEQHDWLPAFRTSWSPAGQAAAIRESILDAFRALLVRSADEVSVMRIQAPLDRFLGGIVDEVFAGQRAALSALAIGTPGDAARLAAHLEGFRKLPNAFLWRASDLTAEVKRAEQAVVGRLRGLPPAQLAAEARLLGLTDEVAASVATADDLALLMRGEATAADLAAQLVARTRAGAPPAAAIRKSFETMPELSEFERAEALKAAADARLTAAQTAPAFRMGAIQEALADDVKALFPEEWARELAGLAEEGGWVARLSPRDKASLAADAVLRKRGHGATLQITRAAMQDAARVDDLARELGVSTRALAATKKATNDFIAARAVAMGLHDETAAASAALTAAKKKLQAAARKALVDHRADTAAKTVLARPEKVAKGKRKGLYARMYPDDRHEAVLEAFDWLEEVAGRRLPVLDHKDLLSGRGRSHQQGRRMFLSKGEGARTVIHEYGHFLEGFDARARQLAQDFLRRRTAGETTRRLSAITGRKGYRSSEVARKDLFIEPYMGKIYGSYDGTLFATEIFSMGLEMLFYDPIRLARLDPEYFDLIVDFLLGF